MTITNSLNNSSSTFAVGANPTAVSVNIPLTVGYDSNASTAVRISNGAASASAVTQLNITSDLAQAYITVGSSNQNVLRWRKRVEFSDNTDSLGVNITSTSLTGDIRFYTVGNVLSSSISTTAITNNLPVTITGSAHTQLTVQDTSATSASDGSIIDLYRSGTSTSGHQIGAIYFSAKDSAGTKIIPCYINNILTTNTAAAVDSQMSFNVNKASVPVLALSLTGSAATLVVPLTISGGASLTPLNISSTDAGATAGPIIDIYRNSASPANADILGQLTFTGNSSNATKRTYASVTSNAITVTDTTEEGSIGFSVMSAGTLTQTALLTKTGLNATAIGATTASTGAFTTISGTVATLTGTGSLFLKKGTVSSYVVTATTSGTLSITHSCGEGTVGVTITYTQYNTSTGANKIFEFYSGAVGHFSSGTFSSGPTSIWRHDFGGTAGNLTTWAFANILLGSFDITYTIPANNFMQAVIEIMPHK